MQAPAVRTPKRSEGKIARFFLPFLLILGWTSAVPLRAAAPHLVFLIAEDEYQAAETLPQFAAEQLADNFQITILTQAADNPHSIPGMETLTQADLVVLYVRRRSLPAGQMRLFKNYLKSGKPLLALRTSSHAWHTRHRGPKNQVEWKTFDPEVLGGNYRGHYGKGAKTKIAAVPGMAAHPALEGVDIQQLIGQGSLYRVSPLATAVQVILTGEIPGHPPEPILWFHRYGKSPIAYTSLGHIGDFAQPAFNRLLRNTIAHLLKTSADAKHPATKPREK